MDDVFTVIVSEVEKERLADEMEKIEKKDKLRASNVTLETLGTQGSWCLSA